MKTAELLKVVPLTIVIVLILATTGILVGVLMARDIPSIAGIAPFENSFSRIYRRTFLLLTIGLVMRVTALGIHN